MNIPERDDDSGDWLWVSLVKGHDDFLPHPRWRDDFVRAESLRKIVDLPLLFIYGDKEEVWVRAYIHKSLLDDEVT